MKRAAERLVWEAWWRHGLGCSQRTAAPWTGDAERLSFCCFTRAHTGRAPETFVLHQSKEILFFHCASLRSQPQKNIDFHYQYFIPICACQVSPATLLMCPSIVESRDEHCLGSGQYLQVGCSYLGCQLVIRVCCQGKYATFWRHMKILESPFDNISIIHNQTVKNIHCNTL